jgi:Laminin G domain
MMKRASRTAIVIPVAIATSLAGLMMASPAGAAATHTVALYNMNEAAGSHVLVDSSGHGLNGTIGAEVTTGAVFSGATGHRFAYLAPNTPPAHPGHVDKVADNTLLDPGTSDFAITIRYRTTRSFGNIIQKGQSTSAGGYWKFEQPKGIVTCLFRGSAGDVAVHSATALNNGQWHVVRCERAGTKVVMTVDGTSKRTGNGATGSISNSKNLSIGGKSSCDQKTVTCDYFVGDIDYVRIEKG